MSWIDRYLIGVIYVQSNGATLPQQPILDFRNGLAASNDAVGGRTIVDATGSGGGAPNIREVAGPGSAFAAPNDAFYVNLAAGNYTITPATFGAGESFSVKVLGPVNGHACTVNPLAGGQIETAAGDGTLTATPLALTVGGQEVILESPDGTNLYF